MKTSRLIIAFLFVSTLLFAEETGIITGKVTDKDSGDPLSGANVFLEGMRLGAAADRTGKYTIRNIPTGTYTLVSTFMGYERMQIRDIHIERDSIIVVNIKMISSKIEGERVEVTALRNLVLADKASPLNIQGGVVAVPMNEYFIEHNTEEYDRIYESGFLDVLKKPLSTFAADVDVASYGNIRRYIMRDQVPPKDAVRIEECVNYFTYDYPEPDKNIPLSINMEYADCPWNDEHKLIHIGLQGKKLSAEDKKPSNLVFLLDVSGSMRDPKKLPLLKKSFKLLVNQLDNKDQIAIVVYAGAAGIVLPSTSGSEKKKILAALDQLQAGGSTAGGAGIRLAYKTAKENFIKGGNNRIILATDGDFNVGISSTSELVRFIEEKRDDGIFLTVLGFGMGNYKDNRLQELADRGNGNHAYIDNIMEAKKVLVHEITSTLFTIAKDVKIQVEFNPTKIKSYRLIGYENRRLEDKDFVDDKKDAGEIGAGHTVTVLYEVVPENAAGSGESYDLKYQQTTIKQSAKKTDEILTVRIRYKEPDGRKSKEFSSTLRGPVSEFSKSSENFQFSACVAEFAMLLRDSEFKGKSSFDHVIRMAKNNIGKDPFGYRNEFVDLVERASILAD